MRRLLPLLLIVASAQACTDKPPRAHISHVQLSLPGPLERSETAREALRRQITEQLHADPSVVVGEKQPQGSALKVGIVASVGPASALLADEEAPPPSVTLTLTLHAQLEVGELQLHASAALDSSSGPASPPLSAANYDQAAAAAFAKAWQEIGKQRQLSVADDSALLAALALPEASLRAFAVALMRKRKLKGAALPLLALLKNERDETVILNCIGALVAIGDEAAVPALIDLTYQREPNFVSQVIFAVAAIGGRTAEGFLVTLAGGHPNDMIRKSAEDALGELKRR